MVMTPLGRQAPAGTAESLFTSDELGFLCDYARKFGLRGPERYRSKSQREVGTSKPERRFWAGCCVVEGSESPSSCAGYQD